MRLEPLRCKQCGGTVPLRAASEVPCPFCGNRVPIPDKYHQFLVDDETRVETEKRFRDVTRVPRARVDYAAAALVLLLPALAAAIPMLLTHHPISAFTIFAAAVVPSLLPGTGLWIWSSSIHATVARFQLALTCKPPELKGGPARCRECDGPLYVAPGALSATCGYCGADNLVANIAGAARRLHTALREQLRTLADAVAALRTRRRLIIAGVVVAAVLLAALDLAVLWAHHAAGLA